MTHVPLSIDDPKRISQKDEGSMGDGFLGSASVWASGIGNTDSILMRPAFSSPIKVTPVAVASLTSPKQAAEPNGKQLLRTFFFLLSTKYYYPDTSCIKKSN